MPVYSLFVPGNVAFISCLAVLSNSAAPMLKIFTSAKMAANCNICHLKATETRFLSQGAVAQVEGCTFELNTWTSRLSLLMTLFSKLNLPVMHFFHSHGSFF